MIIQNQARYLLFYNWYLSSIMSMPCLIDTHSFPFLTMLHVLMPYAPSLCPACFFCLFQLPPILLCYTIDCRCYYVQCLSYLSHISWSITSIETMESSYSVSTWRALSRWWTTHYCWHAHACSSGLAQIPGFRALWHSTIELTHGSIH